MVGKGLNCKGGTDLNAHQAAQGLGLSWDELQPALRFGDELGEVEKRVL